MIGKLIRIYVGRKVAQKHGYSGVVGALAGLVAPKLVKRIGSLARKSGSAALERRRERRAPRYLKRIG